jgi:hypothetical protein
METHRSISKLRHLCAQWILPGMDNLDMMDGVCVGAGKVQSYSLKPVSQLSLTA